MYTSAKSNIAAHNIVQKICVAALPITARRPRFSLRPSNIAAGANTAKRIPIPQAARKMVMSPSTWETAVTIKFTAVKKQDRNIRQVYHFRFGALRLSTK